MERSRLDYLAEEVLTQLELKETSLLSWGFVGGKFPVLPYVQDILDQPVTPLLAELWEEQQAEGVSEHEIINNLKERKLLMIDTKGDGRTRYAEAVRLLYALKQRFSPKDWQSAANLVSNIKIQLKYRRYPRRDQAWDVIKERLLESGYQDAFGTEVIGNLLENGKLHLSNFQVQSMSHLLEVVKRNRDTATIIGAGTGSGKTKAFYLPAFAQICNDIKNDPAHCVRALAIYPRVELLKDQLKESLSESINLNAFLGEQGIRPLLVGTYFGDTPIQAKDVQESKFYQWEKVEEGYVCPYLTCPHCTNGQLVWRYEDHTREVAENANRNYGQYESLYCTNCGKVISNRNIALTRKRIEKFPPDILFTTTEMLNLKLGSLGDQHIFGLRAIKPPQFVLLDEVHIHNGAGGAHIAYVLRRWRHLVRQYHPWAVVHFVGLSATLTNPRNFFAGLVGLTEGSTTYITPEEKDLIFEGMEYNLVLRGDPLSATALLSTSVQTAMLMGRMLDPLKLDVSCKAWGPKIFGFTDKMDVINRWYYIQSDAEDKLLLARYRDPDQVKDPKLLMRQSKAGQIWHLAKEIDPKSMLNPLPIGITSSRFRGVDLKAKLVIATSTLEVGFNDPDVGAVIQHKAPRDMASFLQRKGRGGRTPGMRPWTIVVTSAYGRDRWAYDNPEQIFDPTLPELSLPIRNSYIQKIQAAFVLMDWLGYRLAKEGYVSNMRYLLSPRSKGNKLREKRFLYEVLSQVLAGNRASLEKYLEGALKVNANDLKRILWQAPRSLIFDVIPSLLSQLKTDWGQFVVANQILDNDPNLDQEPLAGYVPRNLFSDIEVHELQFTLPERNELESLGLRQGITEFAPGNVSKRYMNARNLKESHWFPVPTNGDVIELSDVMVRGFVTGTVDTDLGLIPVVTPLHYELKVIPEELNDRTTGFLQWQALFQPGGIDDPNNELGRILDVPAGKNNLQRLIKSIRVFMTGENQPVLLTRYASEATVELKFKKRQGSSGTSMRKNVRFTYQGSHSALGFQSYVDAIALDCVIPDLKELLTSPEWAQMLTEFRPQFCLQTLKEDQGLTGTLSVFEIEWLWQICVSSVIAVSVSRGVTIKEALEEYRENTSRISDRTLQAIFQVSEVSAQDEDQQEEARLLQRLKEHIKTPALFDHFLDRVYYLFEDLTGLDTFWKWLENRYVATLAATLRLTVEELCPDVNTDDLLLDIDGDTIWLSEPDAGGMGVISRIVASIESYPNKFQEAFLYIPTNCERHELASALNVVLDNLSRNTMKDVFDRIRFAATLDEQLQGLDIMQRRLYDIGLPPSKELIVAITYKLLNQNSNQNTDKLAMLLHETWHAEEKRLRCQIDPRVFAVSGLRVDQIKDQVDNVLRQVEPSAVISEQQRFTLLESMLWSDCSSSCPDCLQLYSPYSKFAEPSRILLTSLTEPVYHLIRFGTPHWFETAQSNLKEAVKVRIVVPYGELEECRKALLKLVQMPLDMDFELLYPFVEGIHNTGNDWFIDIMVREVLHV